VPRRNQFQNFIAQTPRRRAHFLADSRSERGRLVPSIDGVDRCGLVWGGRQANRSRVGGPVGRTGVHPTKDLDLERVRNLVSSLCCY
jgi:hypothetical protein